MNKILKIGTRESELAVWQASTVKNLLQDYGRPCELVFIKSDGDIDLSTPLYELGVQGIFTKALDLALLNHEIDIAVHSMKDVPTRLATGVACAAVLKRASYKDILVPKNDMSFLDEPQTIPVIATSSTRRKAQWLNRYPGSTIENLRGNVNTRLRKVRESEWHGAIFAAAGLERIALRPANAIDLDWMLPAPAQGAIMVVARENDKQAMDACLPLNHHDTELCTGAERDFLRTLMGGCSTPISALATIKEGQMHFECSVLSTDGVRKAALTKTVPITHASELGHMAAMDIIKNGGREILDSIENGK